MANKIVYKGYNVGETTQVSIMPTATADNSGAIVQYVGATNANYINGYFYKCVSDGGVTPAYSWEKMQVSDGGDTIQVDELPTASADELGNIYEFVGTTTANYINGRFYRCVSDGASTPTYSWEEVEFGDSTPHWSGTRAEYEAIKNTLEVGTIVNITDDYDEGLEVVDVIEEDNMNPVTSNAVAETMAVTTGTGTPATNWAGTVYWAKTGHVVQVSVRNLQYTLGGVPATGTVIATGLPKSVLSDEIFIAGNNGDLGGNYVAMTNNGSLIVKNFNNTSVVSHFDSFTYVTSED